MNWLLAAYLNALSNQNEIEDVEYEEVKTEDYEKVERDNQRAQAKGAV